MKILNFLNNKGKKETKLLNEKNSKELQNIFSKMEETIGIADLEQNIEYINHGKEKNLKELFHYEENEMIYKDILKQCLKEDYYAGDIKLIIQAKTNEKSIFMYKNNNQLFFFIKDLQKYTDTNHKLQEELKKKNETLRSKDLFIANLSHEIRTPMNIIIAMIYFLKFTSLDNNQLEYIKKLEDSSNVLLEIVNNILALSNNNKYDTLNPKSNFNLKELLDNINEIFEDKIKSKDLKWYMERNLNDDIYVYGDRSRLSQLLINLINNAIKYTDRGYIELDVKQAEETKTSYKIQFCVKDTGRGIKKEDTVKIFKEFTQVDDPTTKTQDGSGMGLAIAKQIVEEMNGKIWVESNYGLGSKFYFYINIEKGREEVQETPKEEPKTETINVPKTVVTTNNRILLVEDNEINIEITVRLLKELDVECTVAKNGVDAIKIIEEKGKDYFSLILMDIHMPRYNGYEISKIMKSDLGVEVPIIALTATNITDEIIKENQNYISSYIQKPIMPVQFKKSIQEFLNKGQDTSHKFSFIDSYDEFMQRINYDEQMKNKLITMLYQEFSDIRYKITNLTKEEQKEYLHTLKGALASLGIKEISNEVKYIEENIESPNLDNMLTNLLNKLDKIFEEIKNSNILKIDKTIMLVTTDENKSSKFKTNFSKFFNIIIVKNLKELEIILQAKKVDAVIVDEFDIVQNIIVLIQFLKNKYKEIPILVLNQNKNTELKEEILNINVDSYNESEFDEENLVWNIKKMISKKEEEIKMKADLKKYNNEVENVYGFLYDSLVNLTSLKSKETGQHILRTKEYMKVMLRKYEEFYKEGLFASDTEIENISIAATLHDIGKIGIPDNILNKPGKLTDEEYEIMKKHTIIGRETLESTYSDKLSSEVIEYAKDITLHHHEKYNGKGYPEGLKGDEITVISRIMAVIDVYDALANDRVYKKAMPKNEVEDFIISRSGIDFDPKIINIFLIAKDELAKINENYKDNTQK